MTATESRIERDLMLSDATEQPHLSNAEMESALIAFTAAATDGYPEALRGWRRMQILLLEVEWTDDDRSGGGYCSFCRDDRDGHARRESEGHMPDCEWVDAIESIAAFDRGEAE